MWTVTPNLTATIGATTQPQFVSVIADYGNSRVLVVQTGSNYGGTITSVIDATTLCYEQPPPGCTGVCTQLGVAPFRPIGVDVLANGNIVIADFGHARFLEVAPPVSGPCGSNWRIIWEMSTANIKPAGAIQFTHVSRIHEVCQHQLSRLATITPCANQTSTAVTGNRIVSDTGATVNGVGQSVAAEIKMPVEYRPDKFTCGGDVVWYHQESPGAYGITDAWILDPNPILLLGGRPTCLMSMNSFTSTPSRAYEEQVPAAYDPTLASNLTTVGGTTQWLSTHFEEIDGSGCYTGVAALPYGNVSSVQRFRNTAGDQRTLISTGVNNQVLELQHAGTTTGVPGVNGLTVFHYGDALTGAPGAGPCNLDHPVGAVHIPLTGSHPERILITDQGTGSCTGGSRVIEVDPTLFPQPPGSRCTAPCFGTAYSTTAPGQPGGWWQLGWCNFVPPVVCGGTTGGDCGLGPSCTLLCHPSDARRW